MPKRSRIALFGAGAGAGTMLLVWAVAFHTHFGAQADQSVFLGFAQLQRPRVNGVANVIAQICNPTPFLVLSAVAVGFAFARGRARLAIVAGVILLGANVTTEVLKPLLAQTHPHWMIPPYVPVHPGSWPSGHATAAMSLTLVLVLISPARWRPLVAAGGAVFVVAVCYSFLTLAWHYPSDVLGGYLVAVVWTQVALAALFALDARRAGGLVEAGHAISLRATLTPPAAAVVGAGALVVLVALVKPHAVITFAQLHKTFLVGAAGIGALALALATAVVLGIRATPGSPPPASRARH